MALPPVGMVADEVAPSDLAGVDPALRPAGHDPAPEGPRT
jgi:hypothetical protein